MATPILLNPFESASFAAALTAPLNACTLMRSLISPTLALLALPPLATLRSGTSFIDKLVRKVANVFYRRHIGQHLACAVLVGFRCTLIRAGCSVNRPLVLQASLQVSLECFNVWMAVSSMLNRKLATVLRHARVPSRRACTWQEYALVVASRSYCSHPLVEPLAES
jgi:hypothetical protein